MKFNLMGYSVPKAPNDFNEVTYYNTTTSYSNINNNPFFALSVSSKSNYQGNRDCDSDKTSDVDIDNYKMRRYYFKTCIDKNFYILDRENFMFPVEFKQKYHLSIENYIKNIGKSHAEEGEYVDGIFIVTERKIGNPNFYRVANRDFLPNKARNVYNGKMFTRTPGKPFVEDYNSDEYSFKAELNRDPNLRKWRNVIQYYVDRPHLLSTNGIYADMDALIKVHALYSSNIPGGDYTFNEKPHVRVNNVSENTISFISIDYIPITEFRESKYLSEYDLYVVPEEQLNEYTVHPYSKEGLERSSYYKNKTENIIDNQSENFEVVIYSKTHAINNMCFYTTILDQELIILPKVCDNTGKTDYIEVIINKKGSRYTKQYELTYENLRKLNISQNKEHELIRKFDKEKIEIQKLQLELEKSNNNLEAIKYKNQELEIVNKSKVLELYIKLSNQIADHRVRKEKLEKELQQMQYDLEMKKLDVNTKIIGHLSQNINSKYGTNYEDQAELIRLNSAKLSAAGNAISNMTKLLDSLEYFLGKFLFKV